ncbi:guanylate kinase [Pectinatus haikarae]|uniref:Guanylate kinase n=1 Tax=Pectinatus haikarae TaxID=349096 RepID=A0ABT9Y8E8_9FIRM|nr:guanylate kinase [Pectinatus haikarae]MDQ0203806.1 guanylate kinase [Pectinatus haikarae]
MPIKGNLIILSGPSGTGKGTVCKKLLTLNKNIFYSISATTRLPRPGERNGREYWFLNKKDFERMIKGNKLLEWAKVYDNYYGTPLEKINSLREQGKDVLLEIDTQGALSVMEKAADGIFIFLLPPSLHELEKRIRGRGTETQEVIQKRLDAAVGEISLGTRYHYLVVNRNVTEAVSQLNAIITAEHCRTERNIEILDKVKNEEI